MRENPSSDIKKKINKEKGFNKELIEFSLYLAYDVQKFSLGIS